MILYHQNGEKSQIDLILTTSKGRKDLTVFKVIDCDWHISDHRPVYIEVCLDSVTSSIDIPARAEELNYEYTLKQIKVEKFNKNYNLETNDHFIMRNKEQRTIHVP